MGKTDAEKQINKLIKRYTGGKFERTCVFVRIRGIKEIIDLKVKNNENGIIELRVHSVNKNYPKWYTHGYLIDHKNLRLSEDDIKNKKKIQKVLRHPNLIVDSETKKLISKLDKDFGGIVPIGWKKLFWKTEYFKKHKDPMKIKMKSM